MAGDGFAVRTGQGGIAFRSKLIFAKTSAAIGGCAHRRMATPSFSFFTHLPLEVSKSKRGMHLYTDSILFMRAHHMNYRIFSARKSLGYVGTITYLLAVSAGMVVAQTTAFTYQGKLSDSGNAVTGTYDLQVKLFDALSGGTQQGTTLSLTTVPVSNGLLTVTLDFGACPTCFNGAARFLEISIKPTSG